MVDRRPNAGREFTPRLMLLAFLIVSLGLTIAALMRAPLTWDGSYYFFLILMDGTPMVAHDRHLDYVLHWPVVQTLELTGSVSAGMLVFNFIHVLTPLVALLLCWWIVRREDLNLMFWAFAGILLIMLPGQINFISEGIKAEQLFWPLLMCLIIGLPNHTAPLFISLTALVYWLHPAASPMFFASALTAIVLAILKPAHRRNLALSVVPMIILGLMRYGRIRDVQAESEMTWFTQERQFINSVHGPTAIALFCFLAFVVLHIGRIWVRPGKQQIVDGRMSVALGLGIGALVIWGTSPQRWWEALEFRGPAFWFTMVTASLCVFSEIIILIRKSPRPHTSPLLYPLMAAGFAAVIGVQSVAWNGVLSNFAQQLRANEQACLAREDINGMHRTPLNLWSTTPTSLIMQGNRPNSVSMTIAECHASIENGKVTIFNRPVPSTGSFLTLTGVEARLPEATACTWVETDGWHQRESNWIDTWQWSEGNGKIAIHVDQPGNIELRGQIKSIGNSATVELLVNGEQVIVIDALVTGTLLDGIKIPVSAGTNIFELRSTSPTVTPDGDNRELSFSLWNVSIRPDNGSAPCLRFEQDRST